VCAGGGSIDDINSQQHAAHIQQLLQIIPLDLLARAAASCGAHARALQYFETHVRALRGGGQNPAAQASATYTDEDVAFLQVNTDEDVMSMCCQCVVMRTAKPDL
jgi:serine/threonine-protein kinase ATR